jgi:hypothetical protein
VLLTTRLPTSPWSTPAPAAATTPPTPLPGITGSSALKGPPWPARNWVSTKVMLANATSIETWPGPGTGSGASPATSTSGPPNAFNHTARISSLPPSGTSVCRKALNNPVRRYSVPPVSPSRAEARAAGVAWAGPA